MSNIVRKEEIQPPAQAPAPTSETATIIQMIERAARDPNVDINKMERLWQMHQNMLAQQREQAFNEAMGRAQAEMPQVIRDASNDHTKSRYARLETISKAITPVITKHGFSMSFGTEDSPHQGHYRIVCTVAHAAGHSREFRTDLPIDLSGAQGKVNKTAIQALGSTVSYGRRYLTLLIFNIALTNEDDDGNAAEAPDCITDEQVAEIRELIEVVEADEPKFCKYLKVESLSALPAKRFKEAIDALKAFGRANGKRVG